MKQLLLFSEKMTSKRSIAWILGCVLLFAFLGVRDIWTQENRWVDIVSMMFFRNDFVHPYLGDVPYYDKPLLSYWLIVLLVKLTHVFNTVTVRAPSALFGALGIYSVYYIAKYSFDRGSKKFAILAVWLMLSTGSYLFWARTASADILNIGGVLLAIAYYCYHKHSERFIDYLTFFTIVALASLMKGLVALVLVSIVVGVDLLLSKRFTAFTRPRFYLAFLCGTMIFLMPFLLSGYYKDANFAYSGLDLVYRENVTRYLKPFDHHEPFYVYFYYLPLYLFPWVLFLPQVLFDRVRRFRVLSESSKWLFLSFVLLFCFFLFSGSRRHYYILPVVPFALLVIVDYLRDHVRLQQIARLLACVMVFVYLLIFTVIQPIFYGRYGAESFVQQVWSHIHAEALRPNDIQLLGVHTKVAFYLHMPPIASIEAEKAIVAWFHEHQQNNAKLPKLIVTQTEYLERLMNIFPGQYQIIAESPASFDDATQLVVLQRIKMISREDNA